MNRPAVTECRSCKAPIVWMWTKNNRKAPVDAESVGIKDDRLTEFDPKRHVSHFATCPFAKRHRKKR